MIVQMGLYRNALQLPSLPHVQTSDIGFWSLTARWKLNALSFHLPIYLCICCRGDGLIPRRPVQRLISHGVRGLKCADCQFKSSRLLRTCPRHEVIILWSILFLLEIPGYMTRHERIIMIGVRMMIMVISQTTCHIGRS